MQLSQIYARYRFLMDILPCVFQIGCNNSSHAYCGTDGYHSPIQSAVDYNISAIAIAKRSDVFQKLRRFRYVGNQVQEVHHGGDPKPHTCASLSHKSGDAEANARKFNLENKVCQMKQIQLLPRNIFADHSHRANRKG